MYKKDRMVCGCYDIRAGHIEEYVLNGVQSFDELVRKTRIGVLCSACTKDAMQVFDYYREKYIVK